MWRILKIEKIPIVCLFFGALSFGINDKLHWQSKTINIKKTTASQKEKYDSFLVKVNDYEKEYTTADFANCYVKSVDELFNHEQVRIFHLKTRPLTKEKAKKFIKHINAFNDVVFVTDDFKGKTESIPSEINLNDNWFVSNANLDKAWNVSTGSSTVTVGVIDSGIDGLHSDLSDRLDASNSHGFPDNSAKPPLVDNPDVLHGTSVAGIIGAKGNNGNAAGVCWGGVNLVSLRIDGPESDGYLENFDSFISSLDQAIVDEIPILNFSGGFSLGRLNDFENDVELMENVISTYSGLLVCAAGNIDESQGIYSASDYVYPAALNLDNMITICATDYTNNTTSTSCYNDEYVHLGAPGVSIKTSRAGNTYINYFGGTSAAAPFVSGVAALIKAVCPSATTSQMKAAILNNVTHSNYLIGKCETEGVLNAFKAVLDAVPKVYVSSVGNTFAYYGNATVPYQGNHWYQIHAIPGTFSIESEGNMYLNGTLYGDDGITQLAFSNTGGLNHNFKFTYAFPDNGTYYLKVNSTQPVFSNYDIKITNTHTHSYDFTHVWQTLTYHRSYCSCGSYIDCGHAVPSGGGGTIKTCVICGGPATIGFIETDVFNNTIQFVGNGSYVLPNGNMVLSPYDENMIKENEMSYPLFENN